MHRDIHTPPKVYFPKSSRAGVWVLNGVAQTNVFASLNFVQKKHNSLFKLYIDIMMRY